MDSHTVCPPEGFTQANQPLRPTHESQADGITLREHFALSALCALVARESPLVAHPRELPTGAAVQAKLAVRFADELIAALNAPKGGA